MISNTPGPWKAPLIDGQTTGYIWADEPYGGIIATVHQLYTDDSGDMTANALLIAAAPETAMQRDELLHTLKQIAISAHGQDCDISSAYYGPQDLDTCDCHVADAKAAIGKVKNE